MKRQRSIPNENTKLRLRSRFPDYSELGHFTLFSGDFVAVFDVVA